MKKFLVLSAVLVCLSGCWDEKEKIVCDAACRAERSGKTDFPSLDTSAPDSFKKAPEKGQ